MAALRELREETGYAANIEDVIDLGVTYARGSQFDYTFHLYKIMHDRPIAVRLDEREHTDHRWVTPSEALALPYIEDLDSYLYLHYAERLSGSAM